MQKTGIPKATTFRILSVLCTAGLLEHDPALRRYRVAVHALDLSAAYLETLRLPSLASPYLEALADQCMESSSMAVLDEAEVVYVARAATRRWMSLNLQVGSRLPAHCTSMGRVLLAYRSWNEVEDLLTLVPPVAYTPKTVTDISRLREILAEVRATGFAVNEEELELGLRSAAAPVTVGQEVLAAINISTSTSRTSLDVLIGEFVPKLVNTTREVSEAITRVVRVGRNALNQIRPAPERLVRP